MRWVLAIFWILAVHQAIACEIEIPDRPLQEETLFRWKLGNDSRVMYKAVPMDSTLIFSEQDGIINTTPRTEDIGNHTIILIAYGDCLNTKAWNAEVKQKQLITEYAPKDMELAVEKNTYFMAQGHKLLYEWYVDERLSSTSPAFEFHINHYSQGNHTVQVIVENEQGLRSSLTWRVNITRKNRAPVLVYNLPDYKMYENLDRTPYDLDDFFKDPDDEELEYSYTFIKEKDQDLPDKYVHIKISEGKVTIDPTPGFTGLKSIRFKAEDPHGLIATSNTAMIQVMESGTKCGDGICYDEDCKSCPEDCGDCDGCLPNWVCGEWSNCVFGQLQTRQCMDLNECGKDKPAMTRQCINTCHDNKKNQNEEDVDCGGVCTPCPTCDDGKKNGKETDVDCGGDCDACDDGKACRKPLDCKSKVCKSICQPASCHDQTRNQGEAGIDCGSVCRNSCPNCDDGIMNQDERGIDCGGSCADCPTCEDMIKNQGENRVDCGGPCRPCNFQELMGISLSGFIFLCLAALAAIGLLILLEMRFNFLFKAINPGLRTMLFCNAIGSMFHRKRGEHEQRSEGFIIELQSIIEGRAQAAEQKIKRAVHSYYEDIFKVNKAFAREHLMHKLKDKDLTQCGRELMLWLYDRLDNYERRRYRTGLEAKQIAGEALMIMKQLKKYI